MAEKNRKFSGSDEIEIDIKDVSKYLWGHILWIVLVGVVGATLFAVGTKLLVKPVYQANTSIYVYSENKASGTISNNEIQMAKNMLDTYQAILKSETVMNKVVQNLNDPSLTVVALRSMVSSEIIEGTQVISISVTSEDPQQAKDIANEIVKVAPSEIVRIVKAGGVEVVDYAQLPQTPVNNNLKRNILLGFVVGCAALVGILLIKRMTDTRIKSEDDLNKLFELPVLGDIPKQETTDRKANINWSIYDGRKLRYEEKKRSEKRDTGH